jgi:hypothetical protein
MIFLLIFQASIHTDAFYDNRLFWDILMRSGKTCLDFSDLVNNSHTIDHLAEDRISETLGCGRRKIQKVIID